MIQLLGKNPQSRKAVYQLIDGERSYQDSLPPSRTDGVERTVGDYITMMGHYYNEMVKAWTVNPGNDQALDVMRKIAGIAVHCMEDHGAPPRTVITTTTKKGDKPLIVTPHVWPFPISTQQPAKKKRKAKSSRK